MVTNGNKGLLGVTGDYKGLQKVTRGYGGYKGLQRVTRGYRLLQGFKRVTRG